MHCKPLGDVVTLAVPAILSRQANLLISFAPAFLVRFWSEDILDFVSDAGRRVATETTWSSDGAPVSADAGDLHLTGAAGRPMPAAVSPNPSTETPAGVPGMP
jgi:hypothetical protein